MRSVLAALLLAALVSRAAAAPLTVLYDSGRTVPAGALLADYATALLSESASAGQANAGSHAGPQFVPWPVRTPAMTPGRASARAALKLPGPLVTPLALMGSDAYSLAWLTRRQAWLVSLGQYSASLIQYRASERSERTQACVLGRHERTVCGPRPRLTHSHDIGLFSSALAWFERKPCGSVVQAPHPGNAK